MRKSISSLVLAAGLCLPAAALAQPANTYLGALAMNGTPLNSASFNVAANAVAWFSFDLPSPVRYEDLKWLEVFNPNQTTNPDSQIALWDPAGNRIQFDDDDGAGLCSALSFGTGNGLLPAGTSTLTVNNGRDGDILAAGTYYVSVSYFNVVEGTTGWTITTPGTSAINNVLLTVNGGTTTGTGPANTVDLGTIGYNGSVTNTAASLSNVNTVQWYKMTIPTIASASSQFLDIDTEGTSLLPSNTTRLSMYTASGAYASRTTGTLVTTDTTDGSGSLSELTYGMTTTTRPGVGDGLAFNGRDGDNLRAGVYFFAVQGTGNAPSTTSALGANFGLTSTSANYGTVSFRARNTVTVPPGGTATRSPTFGQIGNSFDVFVTATPGIPAAAITGVSLDASNVDGGTVALHNDGVLPDVNGADNIWSGSVTVGAGATPGAKTLTATVTDATPASGPVNVNYTVIGPPPACPSGAETFSFTNLASEGPAGDAANGVANFNPTGSFNAVAYSITGRFTPNTTFSSETRIRIIRPDLTFFDVQPFTTNSASGVPVDFTSTLILNDSCGTGPVANSGTWTVRIYESIADGAVPDGVWDNLCVALVDSIPASGAVWKDDACVEDAGELPDVAQFTVGSGALNRIQGTFTSTTDRDMFHINVCDYTTFSATTVGQTTADTKLMLFNMDGTGVMHNDDAPAGTLQSRLDNSGSLLSANGDYYLAVCTFDQRAQDASAQLLWHAGTPYNVIIAPDVPASAGNPIASWTGASTSTFPIAYGINLTGVCYPVPPVVACSVADITDIGDTGAGPDGQLSYDDILLYINTFSEGTGCPGVAPCSVADITDIGDTGSGPDGQLSYDDILLYINTFGEGCE